MMPYVRKVFDGMEIALRSCIVQISRGDAYEAKLRGDQVLVDLGQRTCTCYHWDLTGIPCVHAYACLMDRRANPENYVHVAYSRETYLKAYEPVIKPMPGPKYWEKVNLRQPLPPAIRVMPGRPKSKKRKKEKGEENVNHPKRPKRQITCGKCGQLGHNKANCKNQPKVVDVGSQKLGGRPPQDTPWVKIRERRKNLGCSVRLLLMMQVLPFRQMLVPPLSNIPPPSTSKSKQRKSRSNNLQLGPNYLLGSLRNDVFVGM